MTKKLKEEVKELDMKQVIENLKVQLREYKEKYEYFKIMAIKAEGAIEALSQLKKDKNE